MRSKKRVLIGSPIRQTPPVLQEFLQSLKELEQKNFEPSYLFFDNNNDELSTNILNEFSNIIPNVMIHQYSSDDHYYKDETTHSWNEGLIWKVAKMKNIMIQIAIEYNYDYLFLIDSDIVLHPETIDRLISTKKEIISEVFWTKWQPDFPELPQVWLQDHYTLFHKLRNEQLTEEEVIERQNSFINQLRVPGVYEVGGLGACTLISREALLKGVNFSEIKNLSFWGEDRHFCVRAAALDIGLFVDTCFPAYHIYRETDLQGVAEYKRRNIELNKLNGSIETEDDKNYIEYFIIRLLEDDLIEEAADLIQKIERRSADEMFINILKARLLFKQGDTEKVLNFLHVVEKTKPNKRAGLLLAECLEKKGNKFKALKQYSRYIEKEDDYYIGKMEALLEGNSKARISLISTTNSGCNAIAMAKSIPNDYREKYDIRLFKEQEYEYYDSFVKESDLVVTTQANYPFNQKQINIELWHGFPLKAMASMDAGELRTLENLRSWWADVDYISSYSGMFSTLFNACIGSEISKYRVTGAPRNDFLKKDNSSWLAEFLGVSIEGQKLVMFTPTFRYSQFNPAKNEGNRSWANLFGFEEFDQNQFEAFLEEKQIYLIVKLHWVEEEKIKEQINHFSSSRIRLLKEADITSSGFDLYELLGSIDLLITDYSSIFFDFLLLDRPVLFAPVDLTTYQNKRGFLLEPYDTWTPGPKVYNQHELMVELNKLLSEQHYYKNERDWIKHIIHHYADFDSASRVWELIDSELNLDSEKKLIQEFKLNRQLDQLKTNLISYLEHGQLEQFDTLLDQNGDLIEQSSELNTIVATSYYSRGDFETALYYLLQAYSIDSGYFDALYSLAIIYEQLGETGEAKLFYEKAAEHCTDEHLKEEISLKIAL